tara:strand:- start:95 stop:646 length:552 start_codon:yes stop_codon:yes gene_type:complete
MYTPRQQLLMAQQGLDPRAVRQGIGVNQGISDALYSTASGLGTAYGAYNNVANKFANNASSAIAEGLGRVGGMKARGAMRLAGSAPVMGVLRSVPALGMVSGVLGAGNILLGGESGGNKVMDGASMVTSTLLARNRGPLAMAAAAGGGKLISDGVQYALGGGKSPEERKMEQALAMLQTGAMV